MSDMTLEVNHHQATAATAVVTHHGSGMTLHLHYGGGRWVAMIGTRSGAGEPVPLNPGFLLIDSLRAHLDRLLVMAESNGGSSSVTIVES